MAVAFVGAGATSADTTTTRNVAIPAHSAGDLLMLHFNYQRGPTFRQSNQFDLPSGWQWLFLTREPANASDTLDAMSGLAWKFGDGSEATVTPTNTNNGDPFFGICSAWSGVDTTRPFDIVARRPWLGGANPVTITGVTTTVNGALVANFFSSQDNGVNSSISGTTAYNATTTTGNDSGIVCHYTTVASPGASGNFTLDQSIADLGLGMVVAFNPSGEVPADDHLIDTNWAHGQGVGGTNNAVANLTGITTDHHVVGLIAYEGAAPTVSPAGTILDTQSDPTGWTTEIREWTPAGNTLTITVTPTSTNTASLIVGAWWTMDGATIEVTDLAHSSSSGTTTPTGPTVTVADTDATGSWVFSGDDNAYTSQEINSGDAISYTRFNTTPGTDNAGILLFTVDEAAGTSTGQQVTQAANGPDDTSMFSVALHIVTAQNVDVGTATEVELANPITPSRQVVFGVVTETELAQPVTPLISRVVAVGTATERELAQGITPTSADNVPVGTATEVELAQPITPLIRREVLIGTATEIELGRLISPVKPIFVPVQTAVERELARVMFPFEGQPFLPVVECGLTTLPVACDMLTLQVACDVRSLLVDCGITDGYGRSHD